MVQDVGLQSLRTSTTPKVSPPQSVILSGIMTTRPGKKKRVQYHKLFSFADRIDCMLMVAGTLGALAHGISVPVFFIFFSRLINDLGHSFGDVKRQTKEVSNVSDFDLLALLFTSSSSVS
jgi:ATP-binding cassette subfamily B (MDR/TAP) protein 1